MIAKVLLPFPFDEPFDYKIPEGMTVNVGVIVLVPFQSREKIGVVWALSDSLAKSNKKKFTLKEILAVIPEFTISDSTRKLVDWIANYTLYSRGLVLKMVLSARDAFNTDAVKFGYIVKINDDLPMELNQHSLLSQAHSMADIMRMTQSTRSKVQNWIKHGWLQSQPITVRSLPYPTPERLNHHKHFNDNQRQAVCQIHEHLQQQQFSVMLLDGVTGSGKTDVYMEAIAEALRQGQQVLVMLPEIALSPQTISRFTARFGVEPAVWHSHLSLNKRKHTWRNVCQGHSAVIVGARSALLLPFKNLGLIIVDEEHDQSYKQEEGVVYQARDMAVVRAKLTNIPIILVSATPSLETLLNVEQGRYQHIVLPERYGQAVLPHLQLIDCRLPENMAGSQQWLSKPLLAALSDNLNKGAQSLLFLNRRGYAPLTLCRCCGHRFQCIQCSTWMVEHRYFAELRCHQCGLTAPKPTVCPQCSKPDQLMPCGPGVERLLEEAQGHFPEARLLVMASDMVQGPQHLEECMAKIHHQEIDIIIGTQMMAKGHHFNHLTVVGIVDADVSLNGGDLRACEKTYQLLHQVGGRAGRTVDKGTVYIQTYQPEHPVMQALVSHNRDRFVAEEIDMRQRSHMPPFTRLSALILSSPIAEDAEKGARLLAQSAPQADEFEVMGPVAAPLSIVRGQHRWRLLLRSPKHLAPQPYIQQWLKAVTLPKSVRLHIDIDPYSFL